MGGGGGIGVDDGGEDDPNYYYLPRPLLAGAGRGGRFDSRCSLSCTLEPSNPISL